VCYGSLFEGGLFWLFLWELFRSVVCCDLGL